MNTVDIANVIALGAFLLSAAGALTALWQAGVASHARADAQAANASAADHETAALKAAQDAASAATRSADEAKRTADALVEANELARSQIPTDRWSLQRESRIRWSARNISGGLLTAVTAFGATEDDYDRVTIEGKDGRDVQPGESVFFTVVQAWGLPPANVVLSSVNVNGKLNRFQRTID